MGNEDLVITQHKDSTRHSRRSAEESKRIILDAVRRHIETSGAISLKVLAISKETGLAEMTIYRLFKNREGLIAEALVEMWHDYVSVDIERGIQALSDTPAEVITPEFLASLMVMPSTPGGRDHRWLRIQILAAVANMPGLKTRISEEIQTETALLNELVAVIGKKIGGPVQAPSIRIMTYLLLAIPFGFVLDDLQEQPLNDEELHDFWVEFFVRFRS